MRAWVADRWYPLSVMFASFGIAALWWWLSTTAILLFAPSSKLLTLTVAPSTVSGSDLIADLLTISALTISVCIAYICLPRDRVEVKLSTIVKVHLQKSLIEIETFNTFVNGTNAENRTPSCKFVHGLLSPRDGLGGWYGLTDDDLERSLGTAVWRPLRRFVNNHLDEEWVRLLIYGLCAAMVFGLADLVLRFVGEITLHYSSFEIASAILLLLMNVGSGLILVLLVSGTHSGERHVVQRIATSIEELRPGLRDFQESRRDKKLEQMQASISGRTVES